MAAEPNRWIALAIVCAAFFMTVLDVSIVNVALPSIGRSLHFSSDDLQWVITAYAITFGGFLLLGGRAADLLGRRRVFLVGVVIFTLASFFCGLAWSEGVLIGSRAVQGFGAALITPAALSIITTLFEEGPERNKALGIWGALGGSRRRRRRARRRGADEVLSAGSGSSSSTSRSARWRSRSPPGSCRESRAGAGDPPTWAGAVTVTSGLALLVYAVSKAPDHGWAIGRTISLLAASAVLLGAFLVIEARAKDPLMPFHIFRVRTVAGANVAGLLLGAIVFANFFLLTLYVQEVLGWSALQDRPTFIATAGSAVLWAGVAQALVTRIGPKPVMAIGFVAMIAGLLWYTQIPVDGSYWSDLLPGYLLIGFGLPFAFIPVSIAALAGVEHARSGPRLRADQHRAADRRGDRRRGRLVGGDQPLRTTSFRRGRGARRADERLPVGVLGDGRGRDRWAGRHADADPLGPVRTRGRSRSRRVAQATSARRPVCTS